MKGWAQVPGYDQSREESELKQSRSHIIMMFVAVATTLAGSLVFATASSFGMHSGKHAIPLDVVVGHKIDAVAVSSSCDPEARCKGASGEQYPLCFSTEKTKCCAQEASRVVCCRNTSLPREVRQGPYCNPTCDVETLCFGASGESNYLCQHEEKLKCCLKQKNAKSCCRHGSLPPEIRNGRLCNPH
mmetsp:Transcript_106794/g.212078  ORF Transcript_106794/g.212078 Transcript_106794/m.212078 type:complete len:187 (+) Transcript_106794:70-630(+)